MKINKSFTKKSIILAASAVLALGLFCSCGDSTSSEDEATETATKATVTAGEAAEKEAQENDDQATTATRKKTGTEDPAIDSAKAAAYERIEGFDGKWKNIEIDVGDTGTTIDFDWNGEHYQYTFDQTTNQIIE